MTAGFYCMSSKGYYVLKNFLEKYGTEKVEFVVSERDQKIKKDYFDEIKNLVSSNKFYVRKEADKKVPNASVIFAISWRWIIPECENLVTLHDSLLPKYRGFAPLVNCLVNGEKFIGVTAILATKDYDKGPIIAQKSIEIEYPIKINEAIEKIEPLYWEIVDEIFEKINRGEKLNVIEQNEQEATYSAWLDDMDYYINWKWEASKIKRFIDATGFPYDGAKAIVNGKVIRILEAEEVKDVTVVDRERHLGKIIFMYENKPVIICGKGLLKINKMVDENMNEFKVNFRTRFTSPF